MGLYQATPDVII